MDRFSENQRKNRGRKERGIAEKKVPRFFPSGKDWPGGKTGSEDVLHLDEDFLDVGLFPDEVVQIQGIRAAITEL